MGAERRGLDRGPPGLVAALERDWSITVGRGLPGGSASYVARARRADGSSAVLKVALSGDGWADQVATLERAAGRGYVRLLRSDLAPAGGAAGGRSARRSGTRGRSAPDQLRCLADTLALAWQDAGGDPAAAGRRTRRRAGPAHPPRPGTGSTGRARTGWSTRRWLRRAARRRGRPGAGRRPRRPASGQPAGRPDRGREPRPATCSSTPTGSWPTARTTSGWPCGTGRARCSDRTPGRWRRRYCAVLADRSGVDAQRIWEWAFLERVSTGLYVLDVVGAADRVAALPGLGGTTRGLMSRRRADCRGAATPRPAPRRRVRRRGAAGPVRLLPGAVRPGPDPAPDSTSAPSAASPRHRRRPRRPVRRRPPAATQPLALVVHATRPVADVSAAAARRVVTERPNRWSAIGQPGGRMRVVSFGDGAPADVLRAVRSRTDVLGIVPAAAVDASVRVLTVGGRHPLRDPKSYPLRGPGRRAGAGGDHADRRRRRHARPPGRPGHRRRPAGSVPAAGRAGWPEPTSPSATWSRRCPPTARPPRAATPSAPARACCAG